jgi:hypothetical protein
MSIRLVFTSLCMLALSACASAPKPPPLTSSAPESETADALKAEIERVYASFADAVKARDFERAMAHLASDVEWRMLDGSVQHRAEVEALMKDYLSTRADGPYYFEVTSVRSEGGQTVAEVVLHDGDTLDRWTDTWTDQEGRLKNRLGIQHR